MNAQLVTRQVIQQKDGEHSRHPLVRHMLTEQQMQRLHLTVCKQY
jgi:hypothetical protein